MAYSDKHERVLYILQRTAFSLEKFKIAEHTLGGVANAARFIQKKIKLADAGVWDKSKRTDLDLEGIFTLGACHIFAYDPVIDIGFPRIKADGFNTIKNVYDPGNNVNESDLLINAAKANAAKFIDAATERNAHLIKDVSAMPSNRLIEFINRTLESGDEELRWKLFFALASEFRTTRIRPIANLKFRSPEEVIQNFRELYETEEERKTIDLTFDIEDVANSILKYFCIKKFGIIESKFMTDVQIQELVAETNLHVNYTREMENTLSARDSRIVLMQEQFKETNRQLLAERQKNYDLASRLQDCVREVEAYKTIQPTPVAAETPQIERHLGAKIEKKDEAIAELSIRLSDALSASNQLRTSLSEAQKRANDAEELVKMYEREMELSKFYRGKTVRVLLRPGNADKYSPPLQDLGLSVEVCEATTRVRELQSLAVSKADFFFVPLSQADHLVKNALPAFKTIFYDESTGPIQDALYRGMHKLKNAGLKG
jgi:hypothetical protein